MLDSTLPARDVTCLFEQTVGAGLAYLEENTSSPGNELPSPNRFLITPGQRRPQMVGLKGVISDMSCNKQSESAKRGMATVTGDLEQDRQHHTVASIDVTTVDGKMPQGEEKDSHGLASGDSTYSYLCVWNLEYAMTLCASHVSYLSASHVSYLSASHVSYHHESIYES